MLKNIVITILTILVVLFWLGADSGDDFDDPDAVVIEYKCSTLSEYDHVPTEVIEECLIRYRQLTKNTI
jgi:hypothetical protein